mgnify:CR=1 FL=1
MLTNHKDIIIENMLAGANNEQRKAITSVDGPLLIIAGPGTGKTKTLVDRIVYMVLEKEIDPASIMVVTFTKKAAKELLLRVQNALRKVGVVINVREMYIGTIHDICLRIIEDYRDKTYLKNNFRVSEGFLLNSLLYDSYINKEDDDSIGENAERLSLTEKANFGKYNNEITSIWKRTSKLSGAFSKISEEMIPSDQLLQSDDKTANVYGELKSRIRKILEKDNILDFSTMQTETYRLLNDYPEVLSKVQEKIQYIMVDEYQDTNYIQEQIVLKLTGQRCNVCVVGDDDQSMYRFRGATVRNLLQFSKNDEFKDKEVTVVYLKTNYRSHPSIVNCYNTWMKETASLYFDWGDDRFSKVIEPNKKGNDMRVAKIFVPKEVEEEPLVVRPKIRYVDPPEVRLAKEYVSFINLLKENKAITDYNQVAFLAFSLQRDDIKNIMRTMEDNGIPTYAPRSGMFFERPEIKTFIGALLKCFHFNFEVEKQQYINNDFKNYLISCRSYIEKDESTQRLSSFADDMAKKHSELADNTDYAFTELAYMLLGNECLKKYLSVNPGEGVVNERPARNLANIVNALSSFEEYYSVDVLTPSNIDYTVSLLFTRYLAHLYDQGVDEYEDETEYAPSGCVSFLTFHQSKGMEFPVVIANSLNRNYFYTRKYMYSSSDEVLDDIVRRYAKHSEGENINNIDYYDFWRLYYVAFSRAKNLLILSGIDNGRDDEYALPAQPFKKLMSQCDVPDYRNIDYSKISAESVTSTDLMKVYSFTSQIGVYETCPQQYKYFKEYGFPEVGNGATLFGSLVHQTVEAIHRMAIDKKTDEITPENIEKWLMDNYRTLSSTTRGHLGKGQIKSALKQVMRYVDWRQGQWDKIMETEVEVSLVEDSYILTGNIDLVEGNDGKLELVDFKTQSASELRANQDWINKYQRQLAMYAHLIHKRTGQEVSRTALYCTKDDDPNPFIIIDIEKSQGLEIIDEFRETVNRIEQHDYSGRPVKKDTCNNCSMRHACADRIS